VDWLSELNITTGKIIFWTVAVVLIAALFLFNVRARARGIGGGLSDDRPD